MKKTNFCIKISLPLVILSLLSFFVYNSQTRAAIPTGDGADGACTVSSNININTGSCVGKGTADGVNFISTANTSAGSSTIVLSTTPTGLAVNDEILIINLMGTSGNYSNVGKYEFKTITNITSNTLTLDNTLTNGYDGTTQKIMIQRVPNYTSVTVNGGYTLTANAFNGTKGGIIAFRATGTVTVNGTISTNYLGYRGGSSTTTTANNGESYDGFYGNATTGDGTLGSGEGDAATNITQGTAGTRGGGGGGGVEAGGASDDGGGGGGGGGYGGGGGGGSGGANNSESGGNGGSGGDTDIVAGGGGGAGYNVAGAGGSAGSNGTSGGASGGAGGDMGSGALTGRGGGGQTSVSRGAGGGGGGGLYGTSNLTTIFFGSGGGGGGTGNGVDSTPGPTGGIGGGIILIFAETITVSGSIYSNGQNGTNSTSDDGGSGGGAGGSIFITAGNATLGTTKITASGGNTSTRNNAAGGGGGGGVGRIRVEYETSLSGTTTPTASTYQFPVAPTAPTIGTPTALSQTSIRWAFTDNASTETGFKVYDTNDVLKATCASANLTYCDETGLTANTSYTRKVVAYNAAGNSSYSATATISTLPNVPTAPTIGTPTALSDTSIRWAFTDNASTETGFKVYDTNDVLKATCASANLSYCDETGLTANTSYTRKVVAYNTGGNSSYSATATISTLATSCQPLLSQTTHIIFSNCSFGTTIIDSRDVVPPYKYLVGVLGGSGTDNTSSLTINNGSLLTVNDNQTVVVGSITVNGSISIATGGSIELDKPVWLIDADGDGFPFNVVGYLQTSTPTYGVRLNSFAASNLVADCNDGAPSATNNCGNANGSACSADIDCISTICGTDSDSDGYFSLAAGHTGTCRASALPYTDCYDSNANAFPGQTTYYASNRGDGSWDYNCDSSTTKDATNYSNYDCLSCSTGFAGCGNNDNPATGGCGSGYTSTNNCNEYHGCGSAPGSCYNIATDHGDCCLSSTNSTVKCR